MATLELAVEKRDVFGKNHMNRLRASGKIPAVLYGHQEAPVSLAVEATALKSAFQQGGNVILSLSIAGASGTKTALMKAVQRDPVSGKVIHVDLYQISMKDHITVRVAVHVVGDSVGVRDGGILEHHLREVEVRCLPTAIPPYFEAEVSACNIGESLHVSDLRIPAGVEVLTSPKETIVTVSAPSEIKETVATPAEAVAVPAAPEVIGEKEREERRAAADKVKDEKKKEKEEAKT